MPPHRRIAHLVQRLRPALFALMLCSQTGCFGTMVTRGGDGGAFAGRYPFKAVASDVGMVINPGGSRDMNAFIALIAFISIPVDLSVDAVLMPVDLVLWPFGFDRSYRANF